MTLRNRTYAEADESGSLPEFLVLMELIRRGLEPGIDFVQQDPILGGRQLGGSVVDFRFFNPPNLAFAVQGVYWHYGHGSETAAHDELVRAQLLGQGITLIFLDEDDITKDVRYIVGEGLAFRDHSRLRL